MITDLSKRFKILHIFDDPKFIEACKIIYDLPNVHNIYIDSTSLTIKLIQENNVNAIFFHYLNSSDISFLTKNELNIPVVWFFWGADGFRLGKFYNSFLLAKSKKLRSQLLAKKILSVNGLKDFICDIFPKLVDYRPLNRGMIKVLSAKIDIIVPVLPEDFRVLSKSYKVKAKLFHYFNYLHPKIFEEEKRVNGNNILLGNSASYSNNHFEAIDILCSIDLTSVDKIIIPLSYGNMQYASHVRNYAIKMLGNKVLILDKFLPAEEYSKILITCGAVIMFHLRQQAIGNIIQTILSGSNVYLNKFSPTYSFLKENGFVISGFDKSTKIRLLTSHEIDHNRILAKDIFSIDKQKLKATELIKNL